MGKCKVITSVVCAVFLVTAGIAGAAPIFSDNFDTETLQTNYNSFSQWTVTDGSVDVIGDDVINFYNFLPGNGRYVDLDGSTGDAGILRLKNPLNLAAGDYLLSFQLAGNQHSNPAIDENVVFRTTVGSSSQTFTLPWDQKFTTYTMNLHLDTDQLVSLEFENLSNDYIGALLDNVEVNPVPEPGTVLLLGAGLLGLAVHRRRRVA